MKHSNWVANHATAVKQALIAEVKAAYKAGDITIEDRVLEIHAIKSLSGAEAIRLCKQSGIAIPKVNPCY